LHAYNQHRGGGGANNATLATIEVSRAHGLELEVFTRRSGDLAPSLSGRLQAGLSAIYNRQGVREFVARLEAFRPDVVHAHELFPLVSPWILPQCTRRGIPVVMSLVDYRLTCPVVTHLRGGQICASCSGGREYRALLHNCRGSLPESATMALYSGLVRTLRLYSGHVSRFVTPSEFTRDWMVEQGALRAERTSVLAPLVEFPESAADPAAGSYVAYAGRFAKEKGLDTLLEAARRTGLPFRLARNEKSLVGIEVSRDVEVVVTRGRHDLAAFYRGARLIVVPSVWFETFGLVGAEAMSHGIPAVASRIGAVAGLVEDGVDGLLFEAGNAADLADKVAGLWNDAERLRRLGRAARDKVQRLWAPERHLEGLQEIYARARAEARAARG
jgi:glycosyltransferase involved in cell wall biosynthesis